MGWAWFIGIILIFIGWALPTFEIFLWHERSSGSLIFFMDLEFPYSSLKISLCYLMIVGKSDAAPLISI